MRSGASSSTTICCRALTSLSSVALLSNLEPDATPSLPLPLFLPRYRFFLATRAALVLDRQEDQEQELDKFTPLM